VSEFGFWEYTMHNIARFFSISTNTTGTICHLQGLMRWGNFESSYNDLAMGGESEVTMHLGETEEWGADQY
jgi:hypothetical protein